MISIPQTWLRSRRSTFLTIIRISLTLFVPAPVVILQSCDNIVSLSADSSTPPSGNWTVKVRVSMYDEFFRQVSAVGPFSVTLTAKDRVLSSTIPVRDSICTFSQLPYQAYASRVTHDGFFPSISLSGDYGFYEDITITNFLYPLPSPSTRIDSIKCLVNAIVPRIQVRCFTAQTVPVDGIRSIVLFAGVTPKISPLLGDYVFSTIVTQSPGSSVAVSDDLYKQLHAAGISTGTTVYLTARIEPCVTRVSVDSTSGLPVYDHLEDNTRAVTSFVMP